MVVRVGCVPVRGPPAQAAAPVGRSRDAFDALQGLLGRNGNVVEVNRPDRAARRRHGKTDTVDATAAAHA
jgi:hypothetical protein